jgi:hypothetical protein
MLFANVRARPTHRAFHRPIDAGAKCAMNMGMAPDVPPASSKRSDRTMLAVRYGLPGAIALAGVIVLIVNRSLNGLEGFAMGIGVAGSILLLNILYRVGVSGDRERDEEEAARVYFDEHGRWPDE